MKQVRYGFVGCGMMGQEHIRNLKLIDGCSIAAIFEPDENMRAQCAQLAPEAVFASSLDALLQIEALDALVITSPNFCHADQLREIASMRTLPILCEKPLYTDTADEATIKQLIKSYDAPVWVGMEYRYMPPVAALIDRAGAFCGDIRMLSITEHRFPFLEKVGDWNRFNAQSGGTFVEKCCHFFDLMRLIIGTEPQYIMSMAGQAHNHLDERYDGKVPDIWDHGYVIVEFENQARAMLELCMFAEGAAYQERICAIGADGKAEAFVPAAARFWPDDLSTLPRPKLELSPRARKQNETIYCDIDENLMIAGDHAGSTYYQHLEFTKTVTEKIDPAVSLEDGMMAVKMGQAAQISATEKRAVYMDEL